MRHSTTFHASGGFTKDGSHVFKASRLPISQTASWTIGAVFGGKKPCKCSQRCFFVMYFSLEEESPSCKRRWTIGSLCLFFRLFPALARFAFLNKVIQVLARNAIASACIESVKFSLTYPLSHGFGVDAQLFSHLIHG